MSAAVILFAASNLYYIYLYISMFFVNSSKEMMALTTVVTMVVASSMWMNTFPTSSDAAVQPFTIEEWRWAIRDGYFNTMVAHYMRHGGL